MNELKTLDKVDSIVILGGGSAGWMAASTLINDHPNKKITVIESKNVPIIGVGESTVNDINPWIDHLGIDIKELLKETDGSLKYATGFTNFYSENSETFFTHFGFPIYDGTANSGFDWFVKKALYPDTKPQDYFDSYIPQSSLVKQNKVLDHHIDQFLPFKPSYDVAYQVNAQKLGKYLSEYYAKPRGVEHIYANVTKVNGNDDGVISLLLEDGSEIFGDLFIDCTGFKSMLLGGFLKEEFTSTKHRVPHNKAIFAPIEYIDKEKELELFTNCYGLKNGWAWNTPLWSRIGSGYTYSDEFVDDETALQEFKDHLDSKNMAVYDPDRSKKMTFNILSAKNGYYQRIFVKNVCAIGLSAGFIDPLEGSGLYMIQSTSLALSDLLKNEKINFIHKASMNEFWRDEVNSLITFIEAHFFNSQRRDSEYWLTTTSKHVNPKHIKDNSIDYQNNSLDAHGIVYHALAAGMNINPLNKFKIKRILQALSIDLETSIKQNIPIVEEMRQKREFLTQGLPTHFEYLKTKIHT